MGATVFLADPEVGGRYSALTAFGLVPSALAGVDVAELLDQAEEFAASLPLAEGNPALALGAALGAAALAGRDKVALVDDGSGIVGLGDWAEQLIAESTGKDGRGILPVVVETPTSPGAGPFWTEEHSDDGRWGLEGPGARASGGERQQRSPGTTGVDVLTVGVGGSLPPESVPGGGITPHVAVNGPLGAQFLAWEYAVAVAGRVLGINPFDQPNVAESKENTKRILESGLPAEEPAFAEGAIEVYGESIGHASTVDGALGMLLGRLEPGGFLAVMAYLDRLADADAARVRPALAQRTPRPVTFGWGPRFLHSTGQYHKGGPQNGSFLQITGVVTDDLPVPGKPFGFGQLQAAQAAGDRQALAGRDRPLVHLHLTDRAAGLAQLLAALDSLPVVS
jgi:glucose-6-phosphate isomerase